MKVSKTPDHLVDRPGYLIKQAQAVLHAEMVHALQAQDATITQYATLTALDVEPGQSNADLARRAFVTPQSMNENLRELERRGWITRRPHPTHGRIQQVELTDAGRRTQRECDAIVKTVEDRMLAALDGDQRRCLSETLLACIDALSG